MSDLQYDNHFYKTHSEMEELEGKSDVIAFKMKK